ncbi:PREDICTED: uncharacterized protein LOC107334100 [Acropora digitifera]|uniref:uncharacterized protein LOC107334100 n=1 Tax=Acropora digitifera TaxID=70779 RepID=UPI00077AE19E|nr:PREDICTED: uncharacterized protein LOC107334100 [Acropora digitifera]
MGELFQVFKFMTGIIAQQSAETAVSIVQSIASIENETGGTSDKYGLQLWLAHQFINECKTCSGDLYRRLIRILPLKDLAESVSFRPETVSEDDVLLIAHELGPLWKKIGLVLKVPKAVISQIEANKSEVFEKCHTVLTSWQERCPYDATYPCLARALKHPAVGREDLAVKYGGLQFGEDVPMAKDY